MRDIDPTIIDALDAGVPAVRAFREAKSETVQGLAAAAGMKLDRLLTIERGATPTSQETASLAVALGVPYDDLIAALK